MYLGIVLILVATASATTRITGSLSDVAIPCRGGVLWNAAFTAVTLHRSLDNTKLECDEDITKSALALLAVRNFSPDLVEHSIEEGTFWARSVSSEWYIVVCRTRGKTREQCVADEFEDRLETWCELNRHIRDDAAMLHVEYIQIKLPNRVTVKKPTRKSNRACLQEFGFAPA